MAKTKVSEWNSNPSSNSDVGGIDINEGCAPSGINNAIREVMAQIKDMQTGADGDNFVVGGNLTVTGTTTLSTDLPIVSGGTGASTAANARTNLGLGTISTQAANNVTITGGSITGITDLAVADGGTGRSTLASNNVLLGNGTSGINTVAPGTSGNVLTSNGTTWQSSPLNFTKSFAANGYQRLPSGLIMQWGNGGALVENETKTISYPIGFPSAVAVVMATITGNTSAVGDNGSVDIVSRNSTSFTAKSTSQVNISGFSWFAIGF
jgi:hypothetical protein